MQASLLAKISVDPAGFDAYYHLGGTSLILNRHARHVGTNTPGTIEVGAIAKPLIASTFRYAQDVGPKDPRTAKLQDFWLESQKP